GVLTMQIALPELRYPDPKSVANFYGQLLERVKALPGVEQAGLTSALPLSGSTFSAPFSIEGRPFDSMARPPHAYIRAVEPGYFSTMSISLTSGRDLSAQDTDKSIPVVIINESLARGFFDDDPVGKRIKIGGPNSPRPWMQIAGVVKDVKSDGLDGEVTPEMYMPYSQNISPFMTLVVHTAGDPKNSIAAIR